MKTGTEQTHLRKARLRIKTSIEEIESLKEARKDLEENFTKLAVARDAALAKVAKLTAERDAANAQVAELTTARNAANAQVAELTTARDAVTTQVEVLIKERTNLIVEKLELERSNTKLLKENEKLYRYRGSLVEMYKAQVKNNYFFKAALTVSAVAHYSFMDSAKFSGFVSATSESLGGYLSAGCTSFSFCKTTVEPVVSSAFKAALDSGFTKGVTDGLWILTGYTIAPQVVVMGATAVGVYAAYKTVKNHPKTVATMAAAAGIYNYRDAIYSGFTAAGNFLSAKCAEYTYCSTIATFATKTAIPAVASAVSQISTFTTGTVVPAIASSRVAEYIAPLVRLSPQTVAVSAAVVGGAVGLYGTYKLANNYRKTTAGLLAAAGTYGYFGKEGIYSGFTAAGNFLSAKCAEYTYCSTIATFATKTAIPAVASAVSQISTFTTGTVVPAIASSRVAEYIAPLVRLSPQTVAVSGAVVGGAVGLYGTYKLANNYRKTTAGLLAAAGTYGYFGKEAIYSGLRTAGNFLSAECAKYTSCSTIATFTTGTVAPAIASAFTPQVLMAGAVTIAGGLCSAAATYALRKCCAKQAVVDNQVENDGTRGHNAALGELSAQGAANPSAVFDRDEDVLDYSRDGDLPAGPVIAAAHQGPNLDDGMPVVTVSGTMEIIGRINPFARPEGNPIGAVMVR